MLSYLEFRKKKKNEWNMFAFIQFALWKKQTLLYFWALNKVNLDFVEMLPVDQTEVWFLQGHALASETSLDPVLSLLHSLQ